MGNINKEVEEVVGRYPAQTFIDSQVAEKLDRQSGVSQEGIGQNKVSGYGEFGGGGKAEYFGVGEKYYETGGCSKILHKCDYEELDFDLFIYEPKVSGGEETMD